jgi:hypothetical protein
VCRPLNQDHKDQPARPRGLCPRGAPPAILIRNEQVVCDLCRELTWWVRTAEGQ